LVVSPDNLGPFGLISYHQQTGYCHLIPMIIPRNRIISIQGEPDHSNQDEPDHFNSGWTESFKSKWIRSFQFRM